ncbi:MAG: nucleoside triphosphate pyrophosphatase [Bdellovibrionota bacterium]|nr:nucleoside triphosphate pyrophosphatase [Bdellovibrionota bacterium]
MKKLVLASTSPYRRALLEQLRLPFECASSDVDEDIFKKEIADPHELTQVLAKQKAKVIFDSLTPDEQREVVIIGGDQVSLHRGKVLGKPHTKENAVKQLLTLQGDNHQLISATCVYTCDEVYEWSETTTMKMRPLSKEQAQNYVEKDLPLDCAGSYKIESLGINLFDAITCPDYTAIIGLPLIRLSSYLRKVGLDPLNN